MMQIRLLSFPPAALYMVLCLFNACIQLGNFIGSRLAKSIHLYSHEPTFSLILILAGLSSLAAVVWFWLLKHPKSLLPQESL